MSTMFVSYAAADERLWKQIETQLKPYSGGSAGQIELWSPHDIIAGQVRKREIEEHLKTARTILLLLSPDYFFDAECEQQMRAALARRQEGGDQVDVVPILLRPCLWQRDGLEDLQILPHNKVPVTKWSDRDEVLLNITIEIRLIIGHVDKSGPVTVPPLSPPKEEVDVGIIIALKEEFSVLFADIGAGSRAVHDTQTNEIYYRFERNSSVTGRPYRCITTFIGGMGPTQAALQAERMITRWNPSTLVLPGIAASLSSSARLGDIVVADQVDGYMENAKANPVAGNQGYDLAFSGEAYRTSSTLLKEVQNFEFTTPAMFQAWQKGTEATLQQLVGGCERRSHKQEDAA